MYTIIVQLKYWKSNNVLQYVLMTIIQTSIIFIISMKSIFHDGGHFIYVNIVLIGTFTTVNNCID